MAAALCHAALCLVCSLSERSNRYLPYESELMMVMMEEAEQKGWRRRRENGGGGADVFTVFTLLSN